MLRLEDTRFEFQPRQTTSPNNQSTNLNSSNGTAGFSFVIQRPRREVGYSPPSSSKVMNEWSYTSIYLYAFMVCIGTTGVTC